MIIILEKIIPILVIIFIITPVFFLQLTAELLRFFADKLEVFCYMVEQKINKNNIDIK